MAQSKNNRKSEGLCQKIHNAVCPFKSRIRRITHQPQGSISITSDKKTPSQITENPARVHVLHQPSLSKMIPVEYEPPAAHFPAQDTKKLVESSPVQEFVDRDILIDRGQRFAKPVAGMKEVAATEKVEKFAPTEDKPHKHDQFARARSKKDDDYSIHEGRFSEYISKVKHRMMKTASNVGGGGVEKSISLK